MLACAAAWSQKADQKPNIHFQGGIFTATGIAFGMEPADGWGSVFPVYTAGNAAQPMLGTYALEGGTLSFRPRFPVVPGVAYEAVLISDGRAVASFLSNPLASRPSVTAPVLQLHSPGIVVYPSTDKLPVNTLRLYIYFSAPMSRGEAWQHIHLRTEDRQDVRNAFLEIDQELWDPAQRRLTVLFDPGRIKRGLVPAREMGTPLKEGQKYRLTIDKDWHDSTGFTLTQGFEKLFTAVAAERTPPAPKLWRVAAPLAGSRQPLVVTFPQPMDFALLQRMIQVEGVAGQVAVAQNETEWRFTPDAPWKAGRYRIAAENTLEDISGNHLDRAFDVDLSLNAPAIVGEKTLTLPFTVR